MTPIGWYDFLFAGFALRLYDKVTSPFVIEYSLLVLWEDYWLFDETVMI